ncbi:hypothetical protein EIL50_05225 [bacterium NHP-B]|nr:hypothetical protein EIL50_05225 [bacterium NHP-B]
MHAYVASNNPIYLGKALHELAYRSNLRKVRGLTRRHKIEAIILDSRACPLYSQPHDPVCPERAFTVRLDDTIVPLGAQAWPAPSLAEADYYIWRTQGDERVRPCHAQRDGKVYKRGDRAIPHPGTEPGCRCWAAPLPHSIHVLKAPPMRKSAPPKHVADIEPFLPLHMTHLMPGT